MHLGAILGHLGDDELQCIWSDNPDPSWQYPFSFNHWIEVLEEMVKKFNPDGHKSCSGVPQILERAKKLAEERESPVTEEHLKYMMAQRKKTGL
jgi:hypothetical protein